MDTREEKKFTGSAEKIRGASRKQKTSLSRRIIIAALLSAGLLGLGGSKHRENVQLKNMYTEEFQKLDANNMAASAINTTAEQILSQLNEDTFEKTHEYLLNSSNDLIEQLNGINKYRFEKYFQAAGIDTDKNQVFSVKITPDLIDKVNPENEKKTSYYLICDSRYIEANDIDSVKLEADLRDLVYENQNFSEKKLPDLKNNLKQYASEISTDKLAELTLINNNGKLISVNQNELEKRIEYKNKIENDPVQNFFLGTSEKQKEHLQEVRNSKIKNLPKMANTQIDNADDPDLHQPINGPDITEGPDQER